MLKLGLIGAGPKVKAAQRGGGRSIARTAHMKNWQSIQEVKLTAVCDINDQNMRDFAEEFNLSEAYTDYKDMFAKANLDMVDICTWPGLHCEMIVAAAEAGVKGIYCEKPLCLSLEEADTIRSACRKNNVKFAVGHQRRFENKMKQAKSWIDEGKIGSIVEITGYVPSDLNSWGTHWFDLYQYFLNDVSPVSVIAQIDYRGSIRYGHPVEDYCSVTLKYPGDIRCYLTGDFSKDVSESGIRIIGTQGLIEIEKTVRGLFDDHTGWVAPPNGIPGSSMKDAFMDLVDSILHDRETIQNVDKAYKVTEIIVACYESALKRKEIMLPASYRGFPLHDLILGR